MLLSPTGVAYASMLVGSSIVGVGMMYKISGLSGVRGSRSFLALLAAGVAWQLVVVTHIVTTNWQLMEGIVRVELGFGVLEAVFWLLFASQYTDSTIHSRRTWQALLGGTVLSYAVLTVTNPWHGLMWRATPRYTEPFFFVGSERGVAYFAIIALIYLFVVTGVALFVRYLVSARRGSQIRVALLGVGASAVAGLNFLSIVEFVPVAGFDHASLGTLPFVIVGSVAVLWSDLLDFEPVARDRLVERLDDAVIVLDAHEQVTDYNDAAQRLFPTLPTDVGQPLADAVPTVAEHVTIADRTDVDEGATECTLSVGGEQRHYSVAVSVLTGDHPDADPSGYAVLLRDVTELEEYRRELERQNEQLDRFASVVSHDLRNPLNVADMRAELLADVPGDVDPAIVRDHASDIIDAHERMEAIIEDMLTLAREGQSVASDDLATVELGEVARDAWKSVDTHEATLVIEESRTLTADRNRLRTIFENLMRNAVEHGGAAVTVRVGLLDDGTGTGTAAGGFYVADDGSGIPPDEREAVFEHGYTGSDDGTGFGLSIVETMADSHGWTVAIAESQAGGTRVEIRDVFGTDPGLPSSERLAGD